MDRRGFAIIKKVLSVQKEFIFLNNLFPCPCVHSRQRYVYNQIFKCKEYKISSVFDFIRFQLILYFAKHICPDRFSLTSSKAKKNNFYEVHIYVPDEDDEYIIKLPKKNRGSLKVNFEFMPSKTTQKAKGHILGKVKTRGDINFLDYFLSSKSFRYAKIDIIFYFGFWNVGENSCTLPTLIRLFLLKAFKLIYLEIFIHTVTRNIKKWIASRKFQTPLRSKYEIYEALMSSDNFLRKGTFTKSELSKLIFGNHYIGEYTLYQKVSQSLDWILESCIEDEEITKITRDQNSLDPLYKMRGKGVHYFTLTKEKIKTDESNRLIQHQQVIIQQRMVFLTFLLVIGTFLAVIDKFDKIKELFIEFQEFIVVIFHIILDITT